MNIPKKQKLVISCITLPPLVIGSTILMTNLFNSYKGPIEAIAGWEYGAKSDKNFRPPCKTHYLKLPPFIQRIAERFPFIYFFMIQKFVKKKLSAIKPDAVFAACTPDGLFFTATFIACKQLNIPFWGHMHDLWLENTSPDSFHYKLAQKWENKISQEAEKIFCMTSTQLDYYKKKYNRSYEIIPHCVAGSMLPAARAMPKTTNPEESKTILYTGNISRTMNLDALHRFIKCIDHLPSNYKIKMLTSLNKKQCQDLGIFHKRIQYDWVSVEESRCALKEADVLFLPLSFENCSELEVKTVFATKTLDYLLSGTPILVFSPKDSYHSISARESQWGDVVDVCNEEILATRLINLASDINLRAKIVTNAYQEAERRNPQYYADRLYKLI